MSFAGNIESGRGVVESAAFGQLFGDEIGGGLAALFPSFEDDGEEDQKGGGGVGEDHGRGVKEESVGEPEKHAGEIEDQHAVGEIAAALPVDFDELRDEGEGGAETGHDADGFDGLRGEHWW